MKTLVLMRHAKSNWSGALSDFDRPLNPRGISTARVLGNWLRSNELLPDFALVSAAKRTVETFDELKNKLPIRKKEKTLFSYFRRNIPSAQASECKHSTLNLP